MLRVERLVRISKVEEGDIRVAALKTTTKILILILILVLVLVLGSCNLRKLERWCRGRSLLHVPVTTGLEILLERITHCRNFVESRQRWLGGTLWWRPWQDYGRRHVCVISIGLDNSVLFLPVA
jgi:hypothetical protein